MMTSSSSLIKYLLLVFVIAQMIPYPVASKAVVHSVVDYGAVGDGLKDDTDALKKAWEATCSSSSSSVATMHVPADMEFLTQPLSFKGPCKPRDIRVEIHGTLVAPTDPSKWRCKDEEGTKCHKWIYFAHVDGLTIVGPGAIHGRGQKWWGIKTSHKPPALKVAMCKNVYVSGINFVDNPRVHMIFDDVKALVVANVTVEAPSDSPNSDGIHLEGSTGVTIHNSVIGTGDDCISIGPGCSNVRISKIVCGPGHGISIGSLGKDGEDDKVENIHVSDVVLRRTSNGVRIKTWQGGKGYARNITFERISSEEVSNPIIINQFYCDHQRCNIQESAVKVSDVVFRDISGTSKTKIAVKFKCSSTVPCENIFMDNIHLLPLHGKDDTSALCSNTKVEARGDIVPSIPCSSE